MFLLRARKGIKIRQPLRKRNTYIARPARSPFRSFAEMEANLAMAATHGLTVAGNIMVALPGPLLFCWITDLVDEVCEQGKITRLP